MIVIQLILLILHIFSALAYSKSASNATSEMNQRTSEVLSRRKRFLIFPEGSSFQLVFCNSFPTLNPVDDIMLFGYTAAFAYELPQDPYSPFDHHADPLHRRQDIKEIYYLNENGKVTYKRKYERKFIVNPAMAKRSVEGEEMRVFQNVDKVDRKLMHWQHRRELNNLDAGAAEFHRTSRALLYSKIETLLQGLGANGKECLLKTLCLVGQTQYHPQGSFVQEILGAVFTLPKSLKEEQDYEMKEYDKAHSSGQSCDVMFPDCDEPFQGPESAPIINT